MWYGILSGSSRSTNKSTPVPRRSPPPPPSSSEPSRDPSHHSLGSKTATGGQLGAFWSTQHAKDTSPDKDKTGPKFDDEPTGFSAAKHERVRQENTPTQTSRRNSHGSSKDFEISFFQKDTTDHRAAPQKAANTGNSEAFKDESFNAFVAEFDTRKLSPGSSSEKKSTKEHALEIEVEKLKEQLKGVSLEKAEITSKFEKLSAICRSQRQEIQELKQAVAARTPSPVKNPSKSQTSPGIQPSASPPVTFLFCQPIHSFDLVHVSNKSVFC